MLTWTNLADLRIFSVKLNNFHVIFKNLHQIRRQRMRFHLQNCDSYRPEIKKESKVRTLFFIFPYDRNLVRWHHLQNKLSLIGKSHLHMLTDSTAYLPLHHLEQLVPVARDLSKELKASLKIFRQITCLQWKSTLFTHKNFVSWTFWQKCVRFSSMWERLIFLGSSMNKNKVARGRRS